MEDNLEIETLVVGPFMVNCYVLYLPGSSSGIVVDPGHDAGGIEKFLKTRGLSDIRIFLTHGHFDHSCGAAELAELTGAEVWMNRADEFLLDSIESPDALATGYIGKRPVISGFVGDGDMFEFGGMKFTSIHTPGHSPGGTCLYTGAASPPVLLCGDTLFQLSIGRTDLPGGDYRLILEKIIEKLWPLPGDTRVLPGHGPETTIEFERLNNPFLNNV